MPARRVLFVLAPLLACRPVAAPSTADVPSPPPPREPDEPLPPPAPIDAGRGVVVRPGATLWLDADGTRPFVLPKELPRGGIAMRVIADRGALIEVEIDGASACSGLVLDDFALRFFVAREWLRDVTAKAFEHALEGERTLVVHAGVPVEGAAGSRTVVVGGGMAPLAVSDTNVARTIVVEEASACMEITGGAASIDVSYDERWDRVLAPKSETGRVSTVVADANVYWEDGAPAGKVAAQHTFVAAPKRVGERTCFPVPLAEKDAITLCFDASSVREDLPEGAVTGLIGGRKAGDAPVDASVQGSVVVGTPKVKGDADAEIVRRVVRAHVNELSGCYRRALAEDPTAAGRLTVGFELAADGSVRGAKVVESKVKSTAIDECFVKAIGRWKFPKSDGGGERTVTFPFELTPG